MTTRKKETKLLSHADILQDLALIRASGVELPDPFNGDSQSESPDIVASSQEYTQAARKIIRLHDSNKVEMEGDRIDVLRGRIEELLHELDFEM